MSVPSLLQVSRAAAKAMMAESRHLTTLDVRNIPKKHFRPRPQEQTPERARAAALERGVAPGPKMKLSAEDIERAVCDVKKLSMSEISGKLAVSPATLYRRMPARSTEDGNP
ncbi:hypothetical protein [Dietzia sp. DQ12-45-1b]|uniref:hypothetical protein n=1 Tax=Dietzia sp. DQ12-45-1b TaxID=912801 RepID=UPI0018D25532|nr:hypothetical protein [Dietzia sp. DQ12-45-1b]